MPGLVGDNHDRKVQTHGGAAELENTGNEGDLVRPVHIALVDVYNAVAVQKEPAARKKGYGHACLGSGS